MTTTDGADPTVTDQAARFVETATTLARTSEMSYRQAHTALADVAGLLDAKAERDRLRAAVDAVRKLCDNPIIRRHDSDDMCMDLAFVGRVRAALAGVDQPVSLSLNTDRVQVTGNTSNEGET